MGPDAVPSEDYSRWPPCSAVFLREGRKTETERAGHKKKTMKTTLQFSESGLLNRTEQSSTEKLNTTAVLPGLEHLIKPFEFPSTPHEFKVPSLKECPLPNDLQQCDTPEKAAEYWKLHIATNPYFNPECECLAVLLLNTRRRVKGHQLVSMGSQDTILVHPREIFRLAIVTAANALIVMHNHPSGDSTPSEADIKVTRDLIRAGQLLKLEVLDHVVVGHGNHSSLRSLGYFYQ